MTHPDTPVCIEDPFPKLDFISETLAQSLVARGRSDSALMRWRATQRVLLPWFAAIGAAYFFAHYTHIKASLVLLVSAAILLPLWAGIVTIMCIKISHIQKAFDNKQFDLVNSLLPDAFRMSRRFHPLPFMNAYQLQNIAILMLSREGRYLELGALMLYMWGGALEEQGLDEVPSDFLIANNLAVAFLKHKKFAQAQRIFEKLRELSRSNVQKAMVLGNLALCLSESKKNQEAIAVLNEAIQLNGKDLKSEVYRRLVLHVASNQRKLGEFEESESNLNLALQLAKTSNAPSEFIASCESVMAKIRWQQHRFDESKLHFKNAIDLFESADNPSCLILATLYAHYSAMLTDAGDVDHAFLARTKANQIFEYHQERENRVINRIEKRLRDPAELFEGSEFVTSAERAKYIDALKLKPFHI